MYTIETSDILLLPSKAKAKKKKIQNKGGEPGIHEQASHTWSTNPQRQMSTIPLIVANPYLRLPDQSWETPPTTTPQTTPPDTTSPRDTCPQSDGTTIPKRGQTKTQPT